MRFSSIKKFCSPLLAFAVVAGGAAFTLTSAAQNPEMQQKIADLKTMAAMNKQALAKYTYTQTTTVSLKGEVKKVMHDQVVTGPDGKPQKTSLDPPPAPPSGGRLKQHVVEKKVDEFKAYADSMKTLIGQYVPPSAAKIDAAKAAGNIMAGPAGTPGDVKLVFTNYVKQGDKMTITINKAKGGMQSLSIASYLTDPSDAVTVDVQMAQIPGGPSHVATETINGVSKQMTVVVQNSNYQLP